MPCSHASIFRTFWSINLQKNGATRCKILRLKCTKFDFHWGSAPDPTGRAHSTPADPIAGFKRVLLLKERREKGGEGGQGKESKGKGEE